jgi:hypothetical protein
LMPAGFAGEACLVADLEHALAAERLAHATQPAYSVALKTVHVSGDTSNLLRG